MLGELLNNLFGLAYVKNLKSSVKRREHIERECNTIGLKYSIEEAVLGTDICDPSFELHHGPYHLTYPASAGFLGNQKTSAQIIEKALNTGHESMMMLDDDCIFSHAKNISVKALSQIANIPSDWDVIILGGLYEPPVTTQDITFVKCRGHQNAAGSHGVAIRRSVLPILLETFNGTEFLGDGAIGRLFDLGKNGYIIQPGICAQDRRMFSDINQIYHQY
jgi:hypothetical protein